MKVGCLAVICIFAGILGFSYPIFFVIPGAIMLFVIISKYYKNIAAKYATSIDVAIDAKNPEILIEIFNEIVQKYKSNDFVKIAFENTYDHFLDKAFSSDFPNKEDLLLFYEKNMKNDVLSSHKKSFVDQAISTLSHIKYPTENNFNHVYEILSVLKVNADIRDNANSRLATIKKISNLRKNGLQPLKIDDPITAKKDCFYYGSIDIYKNRKKDGQIFFEFEKSGQIYILNDEIDIVADGGHKKIKFSSIIGINYEDNIIQLTILNRSTPLVLASSEAEYVLAILDILEQS